MKKYINFEERTFKIAKIIERIAQKKLANVHALEVEYCFIARKVIIHITKIITAKNEPAVAVLLI